MIHAEIDMKQYDCGIHAGAHAKFNSYMFSKCNFEKAEN